MTKLRGYIPTMLMLVTVMFGATAAYAGPGIILGGRMEAAASTCEETTLTGVVSEFASFGVGIILGGRFGIILGGRSCDASTTQRAGIILGGN